MIPCLFHCPKGAPKKLFRQVVSHYLANGELPRSQTVDIVTYNNTRRRFPLEHQAEHLNLRLHVVARDFHPWTWVAKITEPKKLLETFFSPDQLIIIMDGNDTIFTRPPYLDEISQVLEYYNSPSILFCPTCANWPPNEECRLFERGLSKTSKPFLSAGAYVGTVKGILEGMEWIEQRRRQGWLKYGGRFDDQFAWRRAHLAFHPRIAVDSQGLLFNRFDPLFMRSIENAERTWQQALGIY